MTPREAAQAIEGAARLPDGGGHRFTGYSVMGVTFASGHVLALRRFPASSLGPGFTSVWHRDPAGRWTFYSTAPAWQSCALYFSERIEGNVHAPILIVWEGPAQLTVVVKGPRPIVWNLTLGETRASRAMNAAARAVPESWCRSRFALGAMSLAARLALGTGRINLSGLAPNGHRFQANPRLLWMVKASRAFIGGADAGQTAALPEQARLRDFRIPQRGVFAVGGAVLEPPGGSRKISLHGDPVPSIY